jgi:hypothetical protein
LQRHGFALALVVPWHPATGSTPNLKGEFMAQKHWWRSGLAALLAASAIACTDEGRSPLEPRAMAADRGSSYGSGSSAASSRVDTAYASFTVTQAGGNFNLAGGLKIEFPAMAICDLATSSYGAGRWEEPCLPQVLPVRVTMKGWYDTEGMPHVDFQPAMRFNPSLRTGVELYLQERRSVIDPNSKILYCVTAEQCVDESLTDASLATRFESNGFVYRRIKHFSGYNVTAGRAVAPTLDAVPLEQ